MQKEAANSIVIHTTIGEDRHLVLDLPADTPTGPVELVIRAKQIVSEPATELTREEARARLLAAGALVTNLGISDDIEPISDEELLELGKLPPGARPSEELIDEDRGLY
jgi:hypothetical protein